MRAASAPAGTLVVKLNVDRFTQTNRRTAASGIATATLTGIQGAKTSVKQRVTLSAGSGSTCKVLHLFLQQLNLKLLGLNADLDKVQLDITGKKGGGVLGDLFCALSKGLKKDALRAAERSARRPPGARAVAAGEAASRRPPGQAPRDSQVLDLVLGPAEPEPAPASSSTSTRSTCRSPPLPAAACWATCSAGWASRRRPSYMRPLARA